MYLLCREFNARSISSKSSSGDPVTEKLMSFLSLPDGWHYGSGKAPLLDTVARLMMVKSELEQLGVEKFEVFPGINGEILLSAYCGNVCIDVTVFQGGRINYVVEQDDAEIFEDEGVELASLVRKIGEEKWLGNCLSVGYTQSTTVTKRVGSRHWRSMIPTAPVYQWSMNSARKIPA